jgi:hypothetical protein
MASVIIQLFRSAEMRRIVATAPIALAKDA